MTASFPAHQVMQGRPFGNEPRPSGPACATGKIEPGKPVPAAILRRARETPNAVRIVRIRDVVPMDFRPDRLTIVIDDDGHVVEVRCG